MKKILIVEDDQLVATAYRKRFVEAGYEVEWAPDGLEGIKMVTAVKPDVVLLDLLMPRLDGIEVLKYIRGHADLKNLPVVVFSNSYMTNLVENAWRAGADQCLMKASTTPAQLFDAVNKAIQKAANRKMNPTGPGAPTNPTAAAAPTSASSVPLAPPLPSIPTPPSFSRPPVPPPAAPIIPLVTPLSAPKPPSPSAPSPVPLGASAPPLAGGKPAGSGGTTPPMLEADPEFQAQVRQLFLSSAPAKMAAVREAASAFIQDQGSSMQFPLLNDLFRKLHSLTGNAAVAGCAQIARYASVLEAFLQELQQKPKFINDSTSRTLAESVTFLETLLQKNSPPMNHPPAKILVVDGDSMASQAMAMAVEKAEHEPTVVNDPAQALATLASSPFAAAVMGVELSGMSGFELCAQMQALSASARTPVLFVTTQTDFRSHSQPEVLGHNEVIAKPFLLIEMALKCVTLVERGRPA